jgi:hypothetical protein
MNDVLLFVARPRDVLLTVHHRHTDAVHTRHDALDILVDFGEHLHADARHDAHVDHDVG